MKHVALLFFVGILAGFALVHLPAISFLSGLFPFFHIVGALAVLVFALALIYMGVKALFKGL
jgi:amino acid transporter